MLTPLTVAEMVSSSPSAQQYADEGQESWQHIQDSKERKRAQNRIAQRSYRKRVKRRIEALEQLHEASESALPPPPPKRRQTATALPQFPHSNLETGARSSSVYYREPEETSEVGARQVSIPSVSTSPRAAPCPPGGLPTSLTPPIDDTHAAFEHVYNAEHSKDLTCFGLDFPDLQSTQLDNLLHTSAPSPFSDDLFPLISAPSHQHQHHHPNASPAASSTTNTSTTTQTNSGKTALHLAAETGHVPTVSLLLFAHPSLSARDPVGRTPLHLAALHAHDAIVTLLLAAHAPLSAQDYAGHTPLHVAALHGYEQIVRQLLTAGSDAEIKDGEGRTALHVAVVQGREGVVRMLVEGGADVDARVAPRSN